jgi:hypothetical protein
MVPDPFGPMPRTPTHQLKAIATGASKGKATITLRHASHLTAAELLEIAAIAPGLIVFDLAS